MMQPRTYCNPLPIADIPSGRWLDVSMTKEDPRSMPDYRSISDPSVVYHEGKWILYPSYAMAYVSTDFVHWQHVDIGVPHLRYSPAVVQFQGKWYLSGHGLPEVYVADDPLGPFSLCGYLTDSKGNRMAVADGCYFVDTQDDGEHLYFYWHGSRMPGEGEADVECICGTWGAELCPDAPWKLRTEPVWINEFDKSHTWQCIGEHNENHRMGWIEGQWMIKIDGRYYLLYSGCGTEYSSYANGVAISTEGPLSGFVNQKNHDPFTEKRSGLLRGAGHGCIVPGPGNTYWTFYTTIFCYNHKYERRIGMDPVGIDEDGELYCPAVTELPQFAPGVLPHPETGNDAGLLPVTFLRRPKASSAMPGREPIYAVDDSVLTWWQPRPEDPEKTIVIPLEKNTGFLLSSVRLIWRDIGMETLDGIMPGPFQYVIEYAPDRTQTQWHTLVDASRNEQDLCIDYRTFEPVVAYAVRLRIVGTPKGIEPGLVSLTAFGTCDEK